MIELLGISSQALFGQLLIGLINGSFYAVLSLGLAVIFGMLNIINFTHGAQYMLGAFAAYFLLLYAGLGYWWAIIIAPIVVGITGIIIERLFLQWLYKLDHLYGLLLTFGLALIFEGTFRNFFGSSGLPYSVPPTLQGGQNFGFMFLPNSRAWVVVFSLAVCLTAWFVIERTKLGSYLRAATENPTLVRAFGINVPRMITLTYGFGVALAALAGVMAAPIYNVSPQMGANLIIVVFAVVVIGGMGSIMGAIVTGFRSGAMVGALGIRRQGIYFAMITLALAEMMYFFAIQAPFTHGEDGIQAVPRGKLFGLIDLANQTNMYVTVLVIFLGCFLLIYRIINSPFREVLKAIRENEARAGSLGYRTERYKLAAFVLSATFAGVAGATKALVFQLASLTDVDWPMSGEVILMTLVGGLGTLFGPVVGAFFMVTLENYLTTIGQWVFVVQGVIFVVCVLLFRRGIVGELAQILRVKL